MRRLTALLLMIGVAACGGDSGEEDGRTTADTLTRAQKDSIVADMPIPGAGAVGAAMRARDRANARTADHDTIR